MAIRTQKKRDRKMEEPKLTTLQEALEGFLRALAEQWKINLKRDNKKATGALINSIRPVQLTVTQSKIIGALSVKDYWKYVENGRKPGKFPPIANIRKWIDAKPVVPRPANGIKPSKEQLAFLIARKIARDGIPAGKQFEEAFRATWRKWEKTIVNAIDDDINNWLVVVMKSL